MEIGSSAMNDIVAFAQGRYDDIKDTENLASNLSKLAERESVLTKSYGTSARFDANGNAFKYEPSKPESKPSPKPSPSPEPVDDDQSASPSIKILGKIDIDAVNRTWGEWDSYRLETEDFTNDENESFVMHPSAFTYVDGSHPAGDATTNIFGKIWGKSSMTMTSGQLFDKWRYYNQEYPHTNGMVVKADDMDHYYMLYNGVFYPFTAEGWIYDWVDSLPSNLKGFDTGGYTGAWGPEGKLAVLHEKEIVLNKQDTENLLNTISILDRVIRNIDVSAAAASQARTLTPSTIVKEGDTLQQEVTIHAEFPNATDHNEIEEAFNTLINRASQYVNRNR